MILLSSEQQRIYDFIMMLEYDGEVDIAIAMLKQAIQAHPNEVLFRIHALCLYTEMGLTDEALALYADSKKFLFNEPSINYPHAEFLLTNKMYREGWRLWQSRFNYQTLVAANKDIPVWDGSDLNGRTLLVAGEHGIGDQIMFARYLKPLSQQSGTVVCFLQLQKKIDGLLSLVSPIQVFSDPMMLESLGTIDCWTALGSLPFTLGMEAPPSEPYISVPSRYRFATTRRKIGLCWRGNQNNPVDQARSLSFDILRPLLKLPNSYYSLQFDDDESGLPNICGTDFVDTAAHIEALDLVITVDTATAHLAGAMGKPVWIMLGAVDWRWGNRGTPTSDWYPSAKLFWQTKPGDWSYVIQNISTLLVSA